MKEMMINTINHITEFIHVHSLIGNLLPSVCHGSLMFVIAPSVCPGSLVCSDSLLYVLTSLCLGSHLPSMCPCSLLCVLIPFCVSEFPSVCPGSLLCPGSLYMGLYFSEFVNCLNNVSVLTATNI
jgi:hypothetical protein